MTQKTTNWTGKFLIAMPAMTDPRFTQTVIYICTHSADGAMGLIINKPSEDMKMNDLCDTFSITPQPHVCNSPIHFGGPVEMERGFVLHTLDYNLQNLTEMIGENIAMTASMKVIEDIANGAGPKAHCIALGYAGWSKGQLEGEVAQNGWLICDANPDFIFGQDNGAKWAAALTTMGVDPIMLSGAAGRA